jgi:hypothetical protein
MKKTALALLSTLLLVLVASPYLRLASANPVPWPTTPNQEKPTLTVKTPQNYTTYNADEVYLNLSVTQPDSWNAVYIVIPYVGRIHSVECYLDGNQIYVPRSNYASFSVKLNQTGSGEHVLNVTVLGSTYYRGPPFNDSHIVSDIKSSSGPVYEYPIIVSDIVYFTVRGGPSHSPSATLSPSPTPSPETSLELKHETEPEPAPFPTTLVAVASGASVSLVCVGLLVYFKKHKQQTVALNSN